MLSGHLLRDSLEVLSATASSGVVSRAEIPIVLRKALVDRPSPVQNTNMKFCESHIINTGAKPAITMTDEEKWMKRNTHAKSCDIQTVNTAIKKKRIMRNVCMKSSDSHIIKTMTKLSSTTKKEAEENNAEHKCKIIIEDLSG
jgi:hypothetical protein